MKPSFRVIRLRLIPSIALVCVFVFGLQTGFAEEVRAQYESEMVAESIRYLHKSITALQKEKTPSNTRRVAPITTVIAGLLDAGVSPEQPLVHSGLDFLARFHADLKQRKSNLSKADKALFKQIAACLKKAQFSPTPPSPPPPISAVCAMPSRMVVTRGVGTSLRVRNPNQPSLQKSIPAERLASNRSVCDALIAAVHGLKSFPVPDPFQPDIPQRPLELVAVLTPFGCSKDRERVGPAPDFFSFDAFGETAFRRSVSYNIDSDACLFANNLSALRTTRHLE